jgi:hypothetical protein
MSTKSFVRAAIYLNINFTRFVTLEIAQINRQLTVDLS